MFLCCTIRTSCEFMLILVSFLLVNVRVYSCWKSNNIFGYFIASFEYNIIKCQNIGKRKIGYVYEWLEISSSLQRAGISSTLEPNNLCRYDRKRPDGLTRFPFKDGKSLFWDSTCVDIFNQTNLARCATVAGAAADQAEKNKRANYKK